MNSKYSFEKTTSDAHDGHIESFEDLESLEDHSGLSTQQTIRKKSAIINEDAMRATAGEHEISRVQALKTYKKADVLWSTRKKVKDAQERDFVADYFPSDVDKYCIVMEGYDTVLVNSFIGYPAFCQKYGVSHIEESGSQISSSWQAALSICGSISNILDALLNGYFTSRYTHRFVSMVSSISLAVFIFIVFLSPNLGVLLAGQFLCGISWGVFATSGPSYAAESFSLGSSWSSHVIRESLLDHRSVYLRSSAQGPCRKHHRMGVSISFAIQWVWPVPLFLNVLIAPESCWYLVRVGKFDKAKKVSCGFRNGT